MVEAVRMGTAFAHDPNAWQSWRARRAAQAPTYGRRVSSRSIERQVMGLTVTAPRLVAIPGQPVRRMKAADVRARMVAKAEKAAADRVARKASR